MGIQQRCDALRAALGRKAAEELSQEASHHVQMHPEEVTLIEALLQAVYGYDLSLGLCK